VTTLNRRVPVAGYADIAVRVDPEGEGGELIEVELHPSPRSDNVRRSVLDVDEAKALRKALKKAIRVAKENNER
jgi:hypothetical protein